MKIVITKSQVTVLVGWFSNVHLKVNLTPESTPCALHSFFEYSSL